MSGRTDFLFFSSCLRDFRTRAAKFVSHLSLDDNIKTTKFSRIGDNPKDKQAPLSPLHISNKRTTHVPHPQLPRDKLDNSTSKPKQYWYARKHPCPCQHLDQVVIHFTCPLPSHWQTGSDDGAIFFSEMFPNLVAIALPWSASSPMQWLQGPCSPHSALVDKSSIFLSTTLSVACQPLYTALYETMWKAHITISTHAISSPLLYVCKLWFQRIGSGPQQHRGSHFSHNFLLAYWSPLPPNWA